MLSDATVPGGGPGGRDPAEASDTEISDGAGRARRAWIGRVLGPTVALAIHYAASIGSVATILMLIAWLLLTRMIFRIGPTTCREVGG